MGLRLQRFLPFQNLLYPILGIQFLEVNDRDSYLVGFQIILFYRVVQNYVVNLKHENFLSDQQIIILWVKSIPKLQKF